MDGDRLTLELWHSRGDEYAFHYERRKWEEWLSTKPVEQLQKVSLAFALCAERLGFP